MFVVSSCNKSKGNFEKLKPNNSLLRIIDLFVSAHSCDECIYEIYIDKINPNYYTTIIYAGKQSLTAEENYQYYQEAINYTISTNGTIFKIYTGVEHYFTRESNLTDKILKVKQYDNTESSILIVKDSFGKLTSIKQSFAYPFIPRPRADIEINKVIFKNK